MALRGKEICIVVSPQPMSGPEMRLHRCHYSGTSSEEIKRQFYSAPEPFWAWVCSAKSPQDAIKELLNCV